MAVNRDRMEQEAMKLLQKGYTERAIEKYVALMKIYPRDRRLRQKVAELYHGIGRLKEAENHYRNIARSMTKAGHHRQSVTIYEKLIKIKSASKREAIGVRLNTLNFL